MSFSFPGLGLDLKIGQVAFKIGSFEIYWYAVVITLGLVLAVLYTYRRAKLFGVNSDKLLDVIFWGFFGGVIGARLYYVAYSWDMFKDDPLRILNFRTGGMAIYGGIIGALLVGVTACKLKKMRVLPVLDLAGMGFLIGQSLGRWGNFFNQEAFGANTSLPWGMYSQNTHDYLQLHAANLADLGVAVDPTMPVHPCFLYESLWCALGLLLLHLYTKHRKFDGEMFLFYIGWYGAGRFVIEGLRTDSLMIGRIRISQLLAALCVIATAVIWLVVRSKIKSSHQEGYLTPVGMTEVGRLEAQTAQNKKQQEKEKAASQDSGETDISPTGETAEQAEAEAAKDAQPVEAEELGIIEEE